jgi:DNA-binding beta-propeller fold protein YncE
VPDLPLSGLDGSTPYAIDETGMVFAGSSLGIGFIDVSSPGFFTLPTPGPFGINPPLVSASAPTAVQLDGAYFAPNAGYQLFFGAPPSSTQSVQATGLSFVSNNFINVTVPPVATPGPKNATLTRPDGWSEVMPNVITSGPEILSVGPNVGSPSGGSAITVWGYGFGSSNTQVLIGGSSARVSVISAPPAFTGDGELFPLYQAQISVPPGTPGTSDVTVTTPLGSATAPGAFQYESLTQIFPVTGALQQVIYDQPRQRLYASNTSSNELEVFDLSSLAYLSPIAVGNLPTELALTPDGTILAAVNAGDGTISVVNPVNMQVTATYTVLTSTDVSCGGRPFLLTAVAAHRMLVDVNCLNDFESGVVHVVNLDNGSLSCTGTPGCSADGVTLSFGGLQAKASTPDGSQLFTMGGYQSELLNYNSDSVLIGPEVDPFSFWIFGDVATNSTGTIFASGAQIFNSQCLLVGDANGGSTFLGSYVNASINVLDDLLGEKLNQSGSLLYIPSQPASDNPGTVDIFDTHTGKLVLQVAMPEHLPAVLNSMAIDETGTKLFVISDSGITIHELRTLPLALASVTPASAPAGTLLTLRGSGFQSGATVSFGTVVQPATFVDAQTLTVVAPTLTAGPTRITITNADGGAYSYDSAFTAN